MTDQHGWYGWYGWYEWFEWYGWYGWYYKGRERRSCKLAIQYGGSHLHATVTKGDLIPSLPSLRHSVATRTGYISRELPSDWREVHHEAGPIARLRKFRKLRKLRKLKSKINHPFTISHPSIVQSIPALSPGCTGSRASSPRLLVSSRLASPRLGCLFCSFLVLSCLVLSCLGLGLVCV